MKTALTVKVGAVFSFRQGLIGTIREPDRPRAGSPDEDGPVSDFEPAPVRPYSGFRRPYRRTKLRAWRHGRSNSCCGWHSFRANRIRIERPLRPLRRGFVRNGLDHRPKIGIVVRETERRQPIGGLHGPLCSSRRPRLRLNRNLRPSRSKRCGFRPHEASLPFGAAARRLRGGRCGVR